MPYLTPAQVRERAPILNDEARYPDVRLAELVAEFEELAERYRGVAFTPRTATETVWIGADWNQHGSFVLVDRTPIRSVTGFTLDGTAVTPMVETDFRTGMIRFGAHVGPGSLGVTYDHGLDVPPPGILRACTIYVRSAALSDQSGTPRDVIGQTFDGGYTRFSTPDWNLGRPTGWLEVDRILNSQEDHRIPGVA